MYRFNTTLKTFATIANTSIQMLVDYAHSMGFTWVNESSEVFYWIDNGDLDFAFFQRK